jgi:YidC/Oxa1 family membrane protein insertase
MPLQIKSQKGMKKQQKIQPIIAELQQKYANDKEKLQLEMTKVYKENNVSMMGGCLPLLIQFPILIGLYRVIQRPLTYLLGVNFKAEDVISRVSDVVSRMAADSQVAHAVASIKDLAPDALASTISTRYQIQFSTWCRYLDIKDWTLNFNFFGLDVSKVPSTAFSTLIKGDFSNISTICLLVIPVVAILTTWISMRQSQKLTGATQQKDTSGDSSATMNSMNKSMSLMMPIMTGFFTLTLPAGLGLYWIASNIMQVVTQFVLNAYFDTKEDDFVVKVPEKNRKNSKKRK